MKLSSSEISCMKYRNNSDIHDSDTAPGHMCAPSTMRLRFAIFFFFFCGPEKRTAMWIHSQCAQSI